MTDSGRAALSKLREIRDVLGRDGAPRRINLRNYAEPGTPAWEAFVEASGLPGHKVRRATMVARINKAIDVLTAQLLGTEAPPERSPPPDGGQPPRSERQRLRRLTPDGVARAREFLSGLRDNPAGAIEPPPDLLHDDRYAPRFVGEIEVQRRSFRTRRQVAEYFGPLLEPIAPPRGGSRRCLVVAGHVLLRGNGSQRERHRPVVASGRDVCCRSPRCLVALVPAPIPALLVGVLAPLRAARRQRSVSSREGSHMVGRHR